MKTTAHAIAFALLAVAVAAGQDNATADEAAKRHVLTACERLDRAEPANLLIRGSAGIGTVKAVGNGRVQYVYSPSEWLISAREQLVRIDGQWVGARGESRPLGFLPGLLAALREKPLELLHREACEVDHRPAEWVTVRLDPAHLLDHTPATEHAPSAGRFRIGLPDGIGDRSPPGSVLRIEVAFLIDPGPREVQRIRVGCQVFAFEEAATAADWREGLSVRADQRRPLWEFDIRFEHKDVRPLPELDLELRTRLRLPQDAVK